MNENRFLSALTLLSRYAFLAAASGMAMKGLPPPLAPAGARRQGSVLWRPSQARPASALLCRLDALRRACLISSRAWFNSFTATELLMPQLTTSF